MWLKTLDMIECATIVSSIGTLAIAISSIYQMHRSQRDSFFPILSIDDIAYDPDEGLLLQLRNYGTGPALNVRIQVLISGRSTPFYVTYYGHQQTVLHVATNESKEVGLIGTIEAPEETELQIYYECIRHRNFSESLPLKSFLEPKQQPKDSPQTS